MSGLSLLFYPDISNWLAQRNANVAMRAYSRDIAAMNAEALQTEWERAREYNDKLSKTVNQDPFSQIPVTVSEDYTSVMSREGIIGMIDIPEIKISLPIYHGTGEDSLRKGVGHLENTALPIGRAGDHTVLTGHRGLSSARLFTDLDKLEIGDMFYLIILNRKFAYEIEEIIVVKPDETDVLVPVDGKDYVSLVTCTPYAINSHRLILRGSHVWSALIADNEDIEAISDTMGMEAENNIWRIIIFLSVALSVLIVFSICQRLFKRKKNKRRRRNRL